MYAQETLFGRYDASIGTILLGDSSMNWTELPPRLSNFIVDGDARYLGRINTSSARTIVVTHNDGEIVLFSYGLESTDSQ